MKPTTFHIRTGQGLEPRRGYVTNLPTYPAVIVALHKERGAHPWVCSEYETGAALVSDCPRRQDAIKDAEFIIERRGLDHMLNQMSVMLLTRGRANPGRGYQE